MDAYANYLIALYALKVYGGVDSKNIVKSRTVSLLSSKKITVVGNPSYALDLAIYNPYYVPSKEAVN